MSISKSNSTFFLLILLLLTSIVSATRSAPYTGLSPAKMRVLARAERALRLAKRQLVCVSTRTDMLAALKKTASAARDCLYRGLSFSEYRKLRDVCAQRSETLALVRHVRARCRRLGASRKNKCYARLGLVKRKRGKAVAACRRIGWDGARDCQDLKGIKKRIGEVGGIDCGTDEDVGELSDRVDALERRVEYLRKMAGAVPSAAPRRE